MNILLTGSSGFVGQRLIARLAAEGHSLHALGRRRPSGPGQMRFSEWDAGSTNPPAESLEGAEALIHLAGEPVAQRWNHEVKSRIADSRIRGTGALVQAIAKSDRRPHTLVSASAIGYYGDRGEEVLTETSPPGDGFLPEVCVGWEREANQAAALGLRVVLLRIGIVLGKEGGALKQMLPPFKMGAGGPMGSGKQWMSWIHADDLVAMILFALKRPDLSGPFNATAPAPARNADFSKELGAALHRPAIVPTPVFALKLLLGEASRVVLSSQRVLPTALESAGFTWKYPALPQALQNAI